MVELILALNMLENYLTIQSVTEVPALFLRCEGSYSDEPPVA